jgi:glycine betaine catabolism A
MIITKDKDVVYHSQLSLGTHPVAVEPYKSPEFYAIEKERIFKRAWLSVAHINDVPDVGDYILKDIPVADAKVIIVRGRDKVIRAFYDVCRHRGSKIFPVGKESGCVGSL